METTGTTTDLVLALEALVGDEDYCEIIEALELARKVSDAVGDSGSVKLYSALLAKYSKG